MWPRVKQTCSSVFFFQVAGAVFVSHTNKNVAAANKRDSTPPLPSSPFVLSFSFAP